VDSAGNLYVADSFNQIIRKLMRVGTNWVVTTLAGLTGSSGSAEGPGSSARFYFPTGVAVDGAGNLYVSDTYNNTIRKLTPVATNRFVTTLGGMAGSYGTDDGAGSAARFSNPNGVAVDSAGNLYVVDFYFNTIRKGYAPPKILNFGFTGGQFRFDLTGPPGLSVIVEASIDLASWLPVSTNIFTGMLHFSDTDSGLTFNRFYRARLP
jgi:hypothetical protein